MKKLILILIFLIEKWTPSQSSVLLNFTSNEQITTYRLPNNSIPLAYDLWIKPGKIEKKDFSFQGRVDIKIKITEDFTRNITLHVKNLIINEIYVDLGKSVDNASITQRIEKDYDFLIIDLPYEVHRNDELSLKISYTGKIESNKIGLFYQFYKNELGEDVWYATTQLQPVYARRVFPCYDEPALRAEFTLRIEHPKNLHALSNTMPVESLDPIDGDVDYLITKFETTPPMQAYLLAFHISSFVNFTNENITNPRVKQRIYARPHQIKEGVLEFTGSFVDKMLEHFENHLGVQYPLKKLDHVSLVSMGSVFGMENLGLITYYGYEISTSNEYSYKAKEARIANLVGHEIAHQFFGNIVSPSWWSCIWLNEGISTLMAAVIANEIFPNQKEFERKFSEHRYKAISRDRNPYYSYKKTLNYYVEKEKEIIEKFDSISYYKASTILRMFQLAFGEKTFAKGLKYYLTEMYYKSATPQDLHRNLQKALDEDDPSNEIDVETAMSSWENQIDYPTITVDKQNGKFVFTRNRDFIIPVTYVTRSNFDLSDHKPKLWMVNTTHEIENPQDYDWIVLNPTSDGLYDVKYSKSARDSLFNYYKYPMMARTDKYNLVHDAIRSFSKDERREYDLYF